MSVREDIASNILTSIQAISSPTIKKATKLGGGARTRINTLEFLITGYTKGAESNIDTARNELAEALENKLEEDITRGGNALDTEVIEIETDAGQLFPYGAISMVVRVIYEHQSGTA